MTGDSLATLSTERHRRIHVARLTHFYFRGITPRVSTPTVSRQAVWAKKKREHLMNVLGPFCKKCGSVNCLTFDCIVPTGDAHHRLSSVARMTYYVRQFNAGNLQVLCSACNSAKGGKREGRYGTAVSIASTLREEWRQFQIRKQNLCTHTGTVPPGV